MVELRVLRERVLGREAERIHREPARLEHELQLRADAGGVLLSATRRAIDWRRERIFASASAPRAR